MPYQIQRKGSKYQVVNTTTGKAHAATTKVKAERQLQILKGVERDWQPTEDGAYTRTVNGQKVKLHIK